MYRFLASTRWVGWLLLVVIFAAACTGLGKWQADRRAEVLTAITHVNNNYDAEPVSGNAALSKFDALPEEDTWMTVKLTGQYLAEDTRIVRNRIKAARPGYEVLVPFRTESGATVIIDRGYLPIGNSENGRPDEVPAPPTGTVTLEARLKPTEVKLDRGAPEGQLASIFLPGYAADLGYPIAEGAYGIMYAEDPAPATTPLALDKPDTDEGPHLSYSYQWYAFGVLAFVGFWYAVKQQRKINAEDAAELAEAKALGFDEPVHRVRKLRAKQEKKFRRDGTLTDEAYEDAMLDEPRDASSSSESR
ncbi:cytochrome oxidase biogenesis protein Surf1, facilitates heme A insertion [Arthrobacter sp. MYb224]|uniref:SURF1 family cytochrome oxidase biogenesis protein n=1 Tax=unclassified Arthrobacter TaxID=235627 RepID=UPI000CFB0445|nr:MULTISPECIES: SURF1 family protein [unclassified Arthrobacter]PRA01025.1 cytochrome oxidase biogenesis protein Surf1, facilitates heme A insertion [Arthrobacter sp. MYb224]PRA06813.1 cytochrome oxidase biogenesis protein Surf1, facilitates heme A insertion [Arthrobacter sp. MYb229]PRB53715.1 cytochrome oxidase biogenesis protein Surf1, facilitates heme A insertion [Arthrobacter sp. MYb216]